MVTMEQQNPNPSVNVYPGNNGGGFGDMFGGMNGGMVFFFLILFFFLMMFMGWGNNNGNAAGNGGVQYVPYPMYGMGGGGFGGGCSAADAVRQGFDQSAIINGINGVQMGMQQGFNNAEISRCNQQQNLLGVLQNQSMALQNCCCENRAAIAGVNYNIATEACNDRAAVKDALYQLTTQNNANMNTMATMFNNGIQNLKDEFCQLRLDSKDQRIAELERQLTATQTASLVNGSTQTILANNDLQTATLEQYLDPTAKPAYIVQNPHCCAQNYNRCCGQ